MCGTMITRIIIEYINNKLLITHSIDKWSRTNNKTLLY